MLALSFNKFFSKRHSQRSQSWPVGCLPEIPAANEGAHLHPISNTSEELKPLKIHSQVEAISAHEMGKLRQKLCCSPDVPGHGTARERDPGNGWAGNPQDRSQKPINPGKKHRALPTKLGGDREVLWWFQLWLLGCPKCPKNEVVLN